MGEVLGPYDQADWFVMGQLNRSVNWMASTDYIKYQSAIKKEKSLFQVFRNKEVA